jgi:3-methyladenine DNA glycosylase AlkC
MLGMNEQRLMKEGLSSDAVARIDHVLSILIEDFPSHDFNVSALTGLESLELKQRVNYLIDVLAEYLPNDFQSVAAILLQVKQHWDWGEPDDALSGFAAWPLIDYVAVHGIDDPELALTVLKELTPLFTAEFAIRPFIQQHFELTHHHLLDWCDDADEHVRRLASEGIRPRLPWGLQLTQFCDDPRAIFPILERLKDDDSGYVRKSVANNLNDISKDHPDRVVVCCQKWMKDASPERQRVIRQALRTLVKSGRADVFPLLGYTAEPKIEMVEFSLNKNRVKLGEFIEFSVVLLSSTKQNQSVVLDYKVHHIKANGMTTAKVFKWKNLTLQPNEMLQMKKSHTFKKITTRKYFSGEHSIELLINGMPLIKANFELIV